MIGLGLRLALRGGRESLTRLAVIALGIGVGVALLLFTLAGFDALHARDARWGWLQTSPHNQRPSVAEATSDPLWWLYRQDSFRGRTIERVDLAATGPRSPIPPGISRLPGPGQYYVSPALADLLSTTSPAQLGDRFPGHEAGVIGEQALTAPDALIVVVGHRPSDLAVAGAVRVRSIETAPRQRPDTPLFQVILGLGTVGLLAPVLIFVATATRLSAARREERFAALRLVGATPAQVSALAAIEAALAGLAGTAIGFGLFVALRPLVADIPFTGSPLFTADVCLNAPMVVGVLLGVPGGAAAAAVISLRRVQASPLGVSRRVTPRPPRAGRLAPLVIGIAILAALAVISRWVQLTPVIAMAAVAGFVFCVIGVAAAGPWLTQIAARVLAVPGTQASSLIARRRLADDPGRAFAAIGGVALVVFVASAFSGVMAAVIAQHTRPHVGSLRPDTLTARFYSSSTAGLAPAQAALLLGRLRHVPGVGLMVPIYAAPGQSDRSRTPSPPVGGGLTTVVQVTPGVVSCLALDHLAVLGRCTTPDGVTVLPTLLVLSGGSANTTVWPAQTTPPDLSARPLQALIVTTVGTPSAIERIRTAIETTLPSAAAPTTAGELAAAMWTQITELEQMANVGIALSLIIAGCSLAVGAAGGLVERRRPFMMLRLNGMRLRDLRWVVMLETAAPLTVAAAVSAAAGLLVADLIDNTAEHVNLLPPSADYYLLLAAGLAAALAVVAATLPLQERITNPEDVRFE